MRRDFQALLSRLAAAARVPDSEDGCQLSEGRHCAGGWHIMSDGGQGTAYERCPREVAARGEARAAEIPGVQTFESFERLREPEAFAASKQWVAACLEEDPSAKLALIRSENTLTNTGCGKSHLLRASAREIARAGLWVEVATAGDITTVVRGRALYDAGERGAADIAVKHWTAADVFVIEDLGPEETAGPVTAGFLMGLLDNREGKPHALASNLTERELTSRYGPPLVSRFLGGALVPPMRGKDYRRQGSMR